MRWLVAIAIFFSVSGALVTAESQDLAPAGLLANGSRSHPGVTRGCIDCHSDQLSGEYLHMMTTEDDCLFCHDLVRTPDAGKTTMMTFAGNETCLACHVEQVMSHQGEDPHSWQSCTSCHSPHSSEYEHLFVQSEVELCKGSCHGDWDLGISHLIGEEVADVRTGSSMSCVSSCHRMHQSSQEKLLQVAYDDLCQRCHEDKS